MRKLGLIAGNGNFPFLVLEEARKKGIPVVVAAIREEASPEIEKVTEAQFQGPAPVEVHWLGLGQLGRLIEIFKAASVDKVVMAGQVRHVQIFSSARPDIKMIKVLMSLPQKNTDSLIGGVAQVLQQEGLQLIDSTALVGELLAQPGVLTRRKPARQEAEDIEYGRSIARETVRFDLGQTIVVKDQAVVAVEAMEGTDETVRRASRLVGGRRLTVVKVSKLNQDMRFDVPVVGPRTLKVFAECRVSAMAVDAGKTLILDLPEFIEQADRMNLVILSG